MSYIKPEEINSVSGENLYDALPGQSDTRYTISSTKYIKFDISFNNISSFNNKTLVGEYFDISVAIVNK